LFSEKDARKCWDTPDTQLIIERICIRLAQKIGLGNYFNLLHPGIRTFFFPSYIICSQKKMLENDGIRLILS
jgi:hypothetical protein